MNDAYPQLGSALTTVTIEGTDSLFLATPALLLPDDREVAWAGAKEHVVHRPDLAWAMGNFLQTDPDGDGASANTNGHIFPTEDVVEAHKLIRLTPLNMLHRKKHVVGHFVAAEMLFPDVTGIAADAANPVPAIPFPYVESLAAIWKWHFPDEYAAIRAAHDSGHAWFSMEAVADTLTCETPGCCGKTYPYKGAHHASYCKTMQKPRSRRRLNKPYFLGGAMVIPPGVPGWKNANLTQVAALIENHPEQAEHVYAEVATLAPHLDAADCEMLMAFLLAGAFDDTSDDAPRSWSIDWDAAFERLLGPATVTEPVAAPMVDAGSGVIVAAVPPLELRQAIADAGTEPIDQCHVTLAYLGKASGDTVMVDGAEQGVARERVAGAIAAFAHGASPLNAEVSGFGRFPQPDGQEVTFALVDSPGLAELRSRLVAALEHAGVPVDAAHGFQPHISVAYHEAGAGTDPDLPTGEKFAIDELELWWGTDHQSFPLAAGTVVASAEMLADIDELYDRAFTAEERHRLHADGKTMPDESYPVETLEDLNNAIAAYGRCPEPNRAALKRFLHRRAEELNASEETLQRIASLAA